MTVRCQPPQHRPSSPASLPGSVCTHQRPQQALNPDTPLLRPTRSKKAMSDIAIAEQERPKHSRTPDKQRVTARVRAAIEAMVWQGLKRDEAAEHAGFTDHALYCAMRKPHVKALYLAECEQLRISGRARRIHRLNELSEQNDNLNAAVSAIKANEQLGEQVLDGRGFGETLSPGITIRIVNEAPKREPLTIDAKAIESES